MDAVSYPDSGVVRLIEKHFIPLRIRSDSEPHPKRFNVTWTPTLITLSPEAQEHHRTVGFLGPDELIPSLLLGLGKYHFEHDRFDEALACLEQLMTEYGRSGSAPEAVFLSGVCRYKRSHDPKPLKAAYEQLNALFPDNQWTKRAFPYRLL
ncbi:MAG: hypothetical protein BWK76_17470 [Desulfobulbaceae bacterium A2]|nr:MAG: hypothetical protein BWK76_17470 [Desulfobulbaceae bacterium A2]